MFLLPWAIVAGCENIIVDDFPVARVVIEGEVVDAATEPVSAAVVEMTAAQPSSLDGDTVMTDAAGAFRTELVAFGVRSFRTDVRVRVMVQGVAGADTILAGVWVQDDGSSRPPDTVHVSMQLSP